MTTATANRRTAIRVRSSAGKVTITQVNPYNFLSSAKQQELDGMDKHTAKVTSSKEEAIAFLKRAGIMDGKGNLAKVYRTA